MPSEQCGVVPVRACRQQAEPNHGECGTDARINTDAADDSDTREMTRIPEKERGGGGGNKHAYR